MQRTTSLLILAALGAACEPIEDDGSTVYGDCSSQEEVQRFVEEHLSKDLQAWRLATLDLEAVDKAARAGEAIELPSMSARGEPVGLTFGALSQIDFYDDALVDVALRTDSGAEMVTLTPAQAYLLGCDKDGPCGVMTLLDGGGAVETASQYEASWVDPGEGWIFMESIATLVANLQIEDPGIEGRCGIIYNAEAHAGVPVEEIDEPDTEDPPAPQGLFEATIPIVLDSDATYMAINPDTVWSRQASLINLVNLIYGFVEPLSSGTFDIRFSIKAQQSWTDGYGPTTAEKYELLDEINDDAYPMDPHPENNELSYTFVGYDMDGSIAGVAGGICNVPGYDTTFASDEPHQDNHAWGQQVPDVDGGFQFGTLYGRVVVAAHEIGHMLGGTHGGGEVGVCAGGTFAGMCGDSLMPAGAAGAPDFRQPFFSDTSDAQIIACVDEVY